jgi:3-oxoacyl-[acyl-carrier protein] reductase
MLCSVFFIKGKNMNKPKVIIITGSSRGIGAGLTRHLYERGNRVVINYSTSRDDAQSLYNELSKQSASDGLALIQADVSQRSQVRGLFRKTKELFGAVDVLINNAGLNIDKPFLELTDEDWDRVIATNLTGAFICSQEFAFQFQGEWGNIVNIGASTAITGRKKGANYCSSKSGVISLTKCLALELAPRIAVNCVIPGTIKTEEVMTRFDLYNPENYQKRVNTIPLGRMGDVEDIAQMVGFLLNKTTFITGQNFFVNGGQSMF